MGQPGAWELAGVNLDKRIQAFKRPARPLPKLELGAPLHFLVASSPFNHREVRGLARLLLPEGAMCGFSLGHRGPEQP